jgi:hypothetical protein
MEEVTYKGEFVNLDRVRLDVAFGDTSPRDIPLYIGATGEKMLEMMEKYKDPAYEAYRDRDQPGVIEAFMEEQRERAKNTKPVVRF